GNLVLARSEHFFDDCVQQSELPHHPYNWRDFTCGVLTKFVGGTRNPDSRRRAYEFLIAGEECDEAGRSAGSPAGDHGCNFRILNNAREPHTFESAATRRVKSYPRHRPTGIN